MQKIATFINSASVSFTMTIKPILLILGIALIFTVFFGYAAEVVFEQPKYPEEKCRCYEPMKVPMSEQESREYYASEEYKACQTECEAATKEYNTLVEKTNFKSFIALSIVAIIAIVTGLVLSLEAISSGILGGGILLLVYSVMRHWGILNKYLRLTLLGIALIVLIYYGYQKIDKVQKKKR